MARPLVKPLRTLSLRIVVVLPVVVVEVPDLVAEVVVAGVHRGGRLQQSDLRYRREVARVDAVVAEVIELLVVDDQDAASRHSVPGLTVRQDNDSVSLVAHVCFLLCACSIAWRGRLSSRYAHFPSRS